VRNQEPGTRNQELGTRNQERRSDSEGRLREHDAWQVVRGEQGLVVVPVVRKTG
jgi:hypothetical protein